MESAERPAADLGDARQAVELAATVAQLAASRLASVTDGGKHLDAEQVLAYDLAHATAGIETARAALAYGERGRRRPLLL